MITSPLPFLSTLSLRRATQQKSRDGKTDVNFYPRSPCGERHGHHRAYLQYLCISIHALLAESDWRPCPWCGGHCPFLSTLSLRRATLIQLSMRIPLSDFYPRSPCGERQPDGTITDTFFGISIHALLAESDTIKGKRLRRLSEFLSTLSLRRATTSLVVIGTNCVISIHALLAESDAQHFSTLHNILISIHALLAESDLSIPITGFLERISIHALLAESDRTGYHSRADRTHFYPRSPCGERQQYQ